MPQEGQKSVTLKEDIYKIAEKFAKKEDRSVSNYIEHLILMVSKKK